MPCFRRRPWFCFELSLQSCLSDPIRSSESAIDEIAAAALCAVLANNTTLQSLSLLGEFVNFDFLRVYVPTLSLSSCFFEGVLCFVFQWGNRVYRYSFCFSAEPLRLSENYVDNDGVFSIFAALEKNTTLQSLSFCGEHMFAWQFGFSAFVVAQF